MSKRFNSALLLAAVICLPMLAIEAGAKSAPSGHPIAAPVHGPHHFGRSQHDGRRRFGHHDWRHDHDWWRHHDRRHRRDDQGSSDWGYPNGYWDTPSYGNYSAPAPERDDDSSYPGWWGERRPYRTGCASEDVAVSSAHGPTTVTVTRCSVPMLPGPPLK